MSQTRAQLVKGFSNTSASADVITVDSSANVGINKTSPVKDLDVTGEIRASTGILFGTDTAAANTLDDYEEGTWTPTFFGSTTAGTYSFTFNSWYTKIGNMVTAYALLANITDTSLGSGNLTIGGLPFTSGPTHNALGSIIFDRFNLDPATCNIVPAVHSSDTVMTIRETRDNSTDRIMQVTDRVTDGSDIFVQVCYKTT